MGLFRYIWSMFSDPGESKTEEKPNKEQASEPAPPGPQKKTGEPASEKTSEKPEKDPEGPLSSAPAVAIFVAGALTTVVTLIGSFGSEEGAMAAARRNHSTILLYAVTFAALGMLLAAIWGVGNSASWWKTNDTTKPGTHKRDGHPGWGALLLAAAAAVVLAGFGLGISATVKREPGDVAVKITRLTETKASVTIAGEGFPSDKKFVAVVSGFNNVPDEPGATYILELARSRLSPVQSGAINWTVDFDISTPKDALPITYLRVVVKDAQSTASKCPQGDVVAPDAPTCVFARLAPPPEPATSTSTSTTSTTPTTTTTTTITTTTP